MENSLRRNQHERMQRRCHRLDLVISPTHAATTRVATETTTPLLPAFAAFALAVLGATSDLRAENATLHKADGQPVLEYQPAAAPFKPYIAQLYTPGGVAVLRDAPADHLHHHALMFAVSVEGVSFWEEQPANGRQEPRDFERNRDQLSQTLEWKAPGGGIVLIENRTLSVHGAAAPSATLVTWHSRLRAPRGRESVTLTGHHYYGLGARFVPSMDKVGEFLNSAGAAGDPIRRTERLTAAAWCAYIAPVDGKPVTFALFDHPANPRHPARMFTMPARFAYLAATLNLWKEPFLLEAGTPLELRYGVALWDGRMDRAAIEALYRRWLRLTE